MTRAEIKKELASYEAEIEDLQERLRSSQKSQYLTERAQQALKALKERLQNEYKRLSPPTFTDRLNEDEQAYYWPAIQDLWANTGVSSLKVNSIPDKKWTSILYDMQSSVGHWLGQLED